MFIDFKEEWRGEREEERERERDRERERSIYWLSPICTQTRDQTSKSGRCPDQESDCNLLVSG